MSKRILKELRRTISHYARKVILPASLALLCLAPNCVYAFDTEVNEWKNVQIYGGGMMTGVVFSPAEKDLIYSRTDMGGVYRWIPETESWKPLTDWVGPEMWSNLGCDGIAVDPNDANRVYMLMGEYDNGWTDVPGAVFCSNDKGDTWTISELPFFCGSNMQGRLMDGRLTVDPNNSAVLYLGSRSNGLWKSEDYGQTWHQMTGFDVEGDFYYDKGEAYGGHLGITFVLCDPRSNVEGSGSQTIYVGIGNNSNSIYKTTDGGKTWAPLVGEPRGQVTNEKTGAWKEVDETFLPQQAYLTKDGMLYVTYATEAGPYVSGYGDVWKYNTNTAEWKLISPISSQKYPNDMWYGYQGLAVDAQDENTLVVTGQSWWPDMMMYRSTDGGETWENVWDFTSYPNRNIKCNIDISAAPWLDWGSTHDVDYNSVASPKIGWNCGAIDIDPFNSDRMMYGTGATLYGTDNLTNWDKGEKFDIKVRAKGIEEVVSNALLVIPDTEDDGLVSSLFDVNGFYHEDVTKVPSVMANMNGDKYESLESSVDADYAELNPSIVFRVGERRSVDSYGSYSNGMTVSKDGGKTFKVVHDRVGASNGAGEVAVSADGSIVLWATPDEPVSWSKGGYNWKTCEGIPTNAQIASDRVNSNMFYGVSKDGKVYYSTDAGKTFAEGEITGLPAVGGSQELNIKAVRGYEGDVWVGTNKGAKGTNGLWHSTDGGQTYTKLNTVDGALSFGFGKAKEEGGYPAIYMVGVVEGEDGFFRSDDMGDTWTRINDDEHEYGLVDAGCDVTGDFDTYGRVYIGTNGRGIVYADTGSGVVAVPNATISATTATFDKKEDLQKNVTVTVNENGHTLEAVKVGDKVLVEGEDYTVDGDKVTILKDFLVKQDNGAIKVTFDFNAGKDPILTINVTKTIVSSSLTGTTGLFDQAEVEDVTVGVELNGNTLEVIKKDEVTLVAGKDYTVVEGTITFTKEYLATLNKGAHEFTFIFSEGNNASFVINVVNTAEKDAVVTPTEASFDKNVDEQADVIVNVILNGNTLEAIQLEGVTLVEGKDYIVGADDTITFPSSYLASLSKGTYDFTFVFSSGESQVVKVIIEDTTKAEVVEGAVAVEVNAKNVGSTNTLANTFKLTVKDESALDLSKLSIRYYFTNEDVNAGSTCWVDNAAVQYSCDPWYVGITGQVKGNVMAMTDTTDTANAYIEITFTSTAQLNNKGLLQVDTRTANNNWSTFDQSNDFSYNDATKVAVFYDGELINGSMPE